MGLSGGLASNGTQGGGSGGGGAASIGDAMVDLCAAPYNHSPGDDITTDLQAVITAATADTTIWFSKKGVYNVNGAQQSGTSGANPYTGQILFPLRSLSVQIICIRIKGQGPPAQWLSAASNPLPTGGTVLQTNATTGNVFDAIPQASGLVASNYFLMFEDICLRAPADPQMAGIVTNHFVSLEFRGGCVVDTVAGDIATTRTGTGTAVTFPLYNNAGIARQSGNMIVMGYPNGIAFDEHFVCEDLLLQACNTGAVPYGTLGHSNVLQRVLIQGCAAGIAPSGASSVQGFIDVADAAGGQTLTNVLNDPSNNLYGELTVNSHGAVAAPGFPVNGAQNIRLVPQNGRRSEWPSDDFTRISYGTYIGASANTHHVWIPKAGQTQATFTIAAGSLKATASGAADTWIKARLGRPSPTRIVRYTVVLGATFTTYLYVGRVISGSNANNYLLVEATGGVISILKNVSGVNTTLAASAAAAISANATHTIDVLVSNPLGGPYSILVLLDGAVVPITVSAGAGSVVSNAYQLAAAEIAQVADTDKFYTQDGLGFFNDTLTSVSFFAVMPN